MYLGIDLGTSGVKVVVMNESGDIECQTNAPLSVSRPQPLWSEQEPLDWWQAVASCMDSLKSRLSLSQVKAISLSGQMHGATLLDKQDKVIRPAILWNDGRCATECREIESLVSDARYRCGNIMMPGFTAPKIRWLMHHEPDAFSKIAKVLLPKDYLTFRLTGNYCSDMSDAAGTGWLNVAERSWDDALLQASGLTKEQMPTLFEGNAVCGSLNEAYAKQWDMPSVPVVAGAGDNAAGAIGVGVVSKGQAMLSLGTSGVYFAVADGFYANANMAVHSFCHALPETWHLMSVALSAASCLEWFADKVAKCSVPELLDELNENAVDVSNSCYFLPYLSGERTPHNNPDATGVFFGLTHATTRAEMTYAVLEGVTFALADGADGIHASGCIPDEICLIGGGARSEFWRQLLADVFNREMVFRNGSEVGPALGAARLAKMGVNPDKALSEVCTSPDIKQRHKPHQTRYQMLSVRRQKFKGLYHALLAYF